jgi:hypothetical protein
MRERTRVGKDSPEEIEKSFKREHINPSSRKLMTSQKVCEVCEGERGGSPSEEDNR